MDYSRAQLAYDLAHSLRDRKEVPAGELLTQIFEGGKLAKFLVKVSAATVPLQQLDLRSIFRTTTPTSCKSTTNLKSERGSRGVSRRCVDRRWMREPDSAMSWQTRRRRAAVSRLAPARRDIGRG